MRLPLISCLALSLLLVQESSAIRVKSDGEPSTPSSKITRRQDKRNLYHLGYGLHNHFQQSDSTPHQIYGPPQPVPAAADPQFVHRPPPVVEQQEPAPAQTLSVAPVIFPHSFVPVAPPAFPAVPVPVAAAPLAPPLAAVPGPVPVVQTVTKHVPVPVVVPKPYPVHVEKIVHVDRPVHVPVPVEVPKPFPVAYPVEKWVRVDRPYPVHVAIPVHVPKPYPVPVAIKAHYDHFTRGW